MKYIEPDEAHRSRILPWLFGTVVQYCFLRGEIYATPGLEGVACWLPPGRTTLSWVGIARSGMLAARFKLGRAATRRFLANEQVIDKVHNQAIPRSHWYLWAIGVDPSCQGQGIGSQLLEAVLDSDRSSEIPCYLETHNPKNLAFYAKHGFKVATEAALQEKGLKMWAMIREA